MKFRLVHLSGGLAGRLRDLDAPQVVLGRDPDAAQVVFPPEDRSVSRRHAVLVEEDGAFLIRDLDSSTGTWVDGEDVEEAELRHGDVFELGKGGPSLRVEMVDGGTLVAMAPPANLAKAAPPETALARGTPAGPGSKLRLTFLSGSRDGAVLDLGGSVLRIGRAPGNTVATPEDRTVSAHHAKVVRLDDRYVLIDLESRNGTYLNERRVERAELADDDVLMLGPGGPRLRVQVRAEDRNDASAQATVVIPNFAHLAGRSGAGNLVREVPLDRDALTIGRSSAADLTLDSPIVSKRHARLVREPAGFRLEDLGSANGTYLRAARIDRAPLTPGDSFVVGPFRLELAAATLRVLDTRNRTRLDARDLTVVAGARTLLDTVSLALAPGSFTALIGPSGAGKSTLLAALSGARPASSGQVLLNGLDLYRNFPLLKASLGFVPQDDIVPRELSVAQSLGFTARLRLPLDTDAAERERRVAEVLATLELTDRRDVPIHRLSGGQRKRVSIAAELLTEPTLLFLDEPTSGLDPGLEESLMLLLRELAYKGKTVVLVTHTLDNIHLCDAVTLLVEGRLAFYGHAREARESFGISHMTQLYTRLKERDSAQWQAAFRQSEGHRLRIREPLAAAPSEPASGARPRPAPSPGALRQLGVLTARYAATLGRDLRNLSLLVAQAPLIAGLIGLSLLYGRSEIAYTKPKNSILFLLALTAVWFGCSNAAREIVKEKAIYLRERMVNLRVLPYVVSKLVVLGALAAVQCLAFLLILDAWFGIPGRGAALFAGMMLASAVGIALGLALSALASTADRAMTLLPILLIPQVLFTSPAVQMDMAGPAGIVARAMPTWWAYDLLRRVALAPDVAVDDDALEARLQKGGPVLMTKARFERMLRAGYPMFQYRGAIEVTWTASFPEALGERLPARLGPWRAGGADALVLAAMGAALLAAAAALQRAKDPRQ